jgi:hypothetical protein
MPSETPDLNSLSTARPCEKRPQSGDNVSGITGHPEIGPVEVTVGPRRSPLRVQIQPEIGNDVAGIGIRGIKRHGNDFDPIWQHDDGPVHVQVEPLVIVFFGIAFCGFNLDVPVNFALRTHDDGPGINHALRSASPARPTRSR